MSTPMALPADDHAVPVRHRAAGVLGLVAASALLRLRFRATVAAVRALRRVPLAEATFEEAAGIVAGCAWAARAWPGRAACVELSLAAVVSAAVQGRRLTWVLGARFGPTATHAWNEAEGRPVGEPSEPDHPWHVAIRL